MTPTLYDAVLKCPARAAWTLSGIGRSLPQHPRALLGIAVHDVLERARSGQLTKEGETERREEAALLFDSKIGELFEQAHPLLRAKFGVQERLPFYNLYRARAAHIAAEFPLSRGRSTAYRGAPRGASTARVRIENRLESQDGRIVGRPDVIDAEEATVIDYKTGAPPTGARISESEARQLRLYAFLASENGIQVTKGVIERTDRDRVELAISSEDAAQEAARALEVLDGYNERVGSSAVDAATPSPEACRYCPFIPLCEAFWATADASWGVECGIHVEGKVTGLSGDALLSIEMDVVKGSADRGASVVTRLSRDWLTFQGEDVPEVGDTVRVTGTGHVAESSDPAVFRADRATAAVWFLSDTGE